MAVPVKYMVVQTDEFCYAILNTMLIDNNEVALCLHLDIADNICKLLNESEGFEYITIAQKAIGLSE